MAIGLSPVLPLGIDPRNGYSLHQDLTPMVHQNLKMVILTCPGERSMDPRFGVGLRNYLFEPDDPVIYEDVKARIVTQVNDYMPYVEIQDIQFKSQGMGYSQMTPNYTSIVIKFNIVPFGTNETMELDL